MKKWFALILALSCLVFKQNGFAGPGEKEKGTPEAPKDAKSVAGDYYRGDGTGFNIYLTLNENGEYAAKWRGCLGEYGTASGTWKLVDKSIVLSPIKEAVSGQWDLRKLEVLKFKDGWILVQSNDRSFYDKYGVDRYSCFQKSDKKKVDSKN